MDHRNLFGMAAIILSSAAFVHSLNSANALAQGPNVSLGSNPIEHHNSNCNTSFYTNNSSNTFVITDIIFYYSSGASSISVSGQTVFIMNSYTAGVNSMQSGIKVEPGETVNCSGGSNNNNVTLSGYYAH
jgi:hypothetical protein